MNNHSVFLPNSPVFIVGGGASLTEFDWSKLAGHQVMAINKAWRKLKRADVLFFADHRFYRQERDTVPANDFWRFNGKRIVTTLSQLKEHPKIQYLDPAKIAPRKPRKRALDISCHNSGLQGICAAFALGASNVVLIGFDGTPGRWSDKEHYKHGGSVQNSVYDNYARDAERLAAYKLPIVNASDDTGLTCFEVRPLSDYF